MQHERRESLEEMFSVFGHQENANQNYFEVSAYTGQSSEDQ